MPNGRDNSPVHASEDVSPIKIVGNSTTTPKDMTCDRDVKITIFALCESVAARLRENGLTAKGVQIIRDVELFSFERQCKLTAPTTLTTEIHQAAMSLFSKNWRWQRPLWHIGVRAIDLVTAGTNIQLSLFEDHARREKLEALEKAMDELHSRFGY